MIDRLRVSRRLVCAAGAALPLLAAVPALAAVYFTGSKARPEAIEAAIANVGSAIAAWVERG